MKRVLLQRPSPGLVVAVAAVILASAGSATATRFITGKQIKNGSITSLDVKNRSLRESDFKPGELPTGAKGPQGARGPQGASGPRGPQGARGGDGLDGFARISWPQHIEAFANGDSGVTAVQCATLQGMYPVGGSAWAVDHDTGLVDHPEVITSQGIDYTEENEPRGYFATVAASSDVDVYVDAACVDVAAAVPQARGVRKKLR